MANMSPTKPRRARSAYNYFFKAHLAEVQAAILAKTGKKGSYSQVSKAVAQAWKKVPAREKVHYHNLAAQDKRRYGLELVQWQLEKEASQNLADSYKATNPPAEDNQEAPLSEVYVPGGNGHSYSTTCLPSGADHYSECTASFSVPPSSQDSYHTASTPYHLPALTVRPMEHMTDFPDALMLTWTEQDSMFLKKALGML